MQIEFVRKLVSRGIISQGTELSGSCYRHDLSGQACFPVNTVFRVHSSVETEDGSLVFNVIAADNSECYQLRATDIGTIDGMTAERIGAVYSIKTDGTNKPEPARRGRKPKPKLVAS